MEVKRNAPSWATDGQLDWCTSAHAPTLRCHVGPAAADANRV